MSTITLAYRFALDLNDCQSTTCAQHAGLARKVWNWALGERNRIWTENQGKDRFISLAEQKRRWTREQPSWTTAPARWAADSAMEDLDAAFKAFWKARRERRRMGLPRFKARGRCRESFRLRGSIRVERERVKLPVLGWRCP